ncbi:hypothetical protein [Streptomyces bluensis]|uniref:hypothetical protein n=1 Tax=Streptomyces bluensis TaxID=33897 RepID=UPI0033267229
MKDWETGKVVLEKVVRRKGFVLGKSSHLRKQYVAEMANGDIRTISVRNPALYDVRVSSHKLACSFETVVGLVRVMEAKFITAELPEVSA